MATIYGQPVHRSPALRDLVGKPEDLVRGHDTSEQNWMAKGGHEPEEDGHDPVHKVLVIQWIDNKVVGRTSTLNISGLEEVQQRKGADIITLFVEKALHAYQRFMDAVDRGDQYREMGGGFANKAHFKKWYKKA